MCADRNKPDGQFVLPPDVGAITEFVATLPIRKVCGIGKVRVAIKFTCKVHDDAAHQRMAISSFSACLHSVLGAWRECA